MEKVVIKNKEDLAKFDKTKLSGADLTNADLTNADLTDADLTNANLTDADLTGANLTGANLTDADLIGAFLTNANLIAANLISADLTSANLTSANLIGANLISANLTDAFLTDANLTGANLISANLTDANLTDANLTGANLTDAFLTNANLTDANLTDANLTDADLIGTNLTGANLSNVYGISYASLIGAIYNSETKFPKDFDPIKHRMIHTENSKLKSSNKFKGSVKMSEAKMSEAKNSFLDTLKKDAHTAMYRVAANQMTNGTKTAILSLLTKNGHSNESIKAVSDLLDTEFGASLISLMLGFSLMYFPMLSEDVRAQKLSEEFRINGMATAGNAVISVAMESFLPVIMSALANLPKEEQVRVAEAEKLTAAPIESQDDNVVELKKTQSQK